MKSTRILPKRGLDSTNGKVEGAKLTNISSHTLLTLNIALGTVYIVLGSKEMKRGSVWGSQSSILGGPCAWGKLGPCARGSRGHGTGPCAQGAPAPAPCVVRAHGVFEARGHGVAWEVQC